MPPIARVHKVTDDMQACCYKVVAALSLPFTTCCMPQSSFVYVVQANNIGVTWHSSDSLLSKTLPTAMYIDIRSDQMHVVLQIS